MVKLAALQRMFSYLEMVIEADKIRIVMSPKHYMELLEDAQAFVFPDKILQQYNISAVGGASDDFIQFHLLHPLDAQRND